MPDMAVHGRRDELDLIATVGATVRSDRRASIVSIVGEAGIGKSALLTAAVGRLAEQGLTVLRTGLSEPEMRLSWAGLHELCRTISEDEVRALPEGQQLAISAALGRTTWATDPSLLAFGLAELIGRVAERSAVVLAIDDLQWLDTPTAAALAFAIRATSDHPVLTVVAARPGRELPFEPERLLPTDRRHDVRLRGVSAAAIHHIVEDRCGISLHRPDLIRLLAVTDGSPLHAIQIALLMAGGTDPATAIAHPTVPAAISSRLDELPADVGRLLGAAAIMASPEVDVLRRLVPDVDVDESLRAAEAADLVQVTGRQVAFRHPLIRSGALDRLGGVERIRLVRAAAELVDDVEERAELLADGATGTDAAVARALETAAERAAERGAPHVAAHRFERAADLTPSDDTAARGHRYLRAAETAYVAGDRTRPVELADRVVDLTQDRTDRFRAAVVRILTVGNRPDRRTAGALARDALTEFDAPSEQARLHGLLGQALMTWDPRAGVAAATAAVEAARRAGDADRLSIERDRLRRAQFVLGEPIDLDAVEQDALDGRPALDRVDLAFVLGHADRPGPAIAVYEAALAEAQRIGSMDEVQNVHDEYAEVLLRVGRLAEAERHWAAWADLQRIVGGTDPAPRQVARAVVLALRGEVDRALDVVRRVFAEPAMEPTDEITAGSFAVLVAETAGDWEELARRGRRVRALAAEVGYADLAIAPFRSELVEALVHLGEVEEAEDVAAEHQRLAETNQVLRGFVEALRSRALVQATRGDLDEAIDTLERAIAMHEHWPVPFDHARNLLALGGTLRRTGRRGQAAPRLAEARAIFDRIGTVPWVERTDTEIARLGARRSVDRDELTPTERQVAELVARGRTNAEVAAQLSVSLRTVESNLTRVYRKLGVRSRTELTVALARSDGAA